jgi:endoglycosylceramidase
MMALPPYRGYNPSSNRPRWLWLAVVALVALVALALPATAAPAPPGPTPPLADSGRWITDADGRAVILHGVNMVYKLAPYAPAAAGFDAADARFLRRHGFDSVRLGLIYAGVEPRPGVLSAGYLKRIARSQRLLARQRIFSLLDFHQDLFNEKFTGEGFPSWSVLDDGAPTEPLTGFPGTYISSPGENAAWDSFWTDAAGPGGVGLQQRFAAAWAGVAKRFAGRRYVMGYDPLNEPWPGSAFATCLVPTGCPAFERDRLGPLEAKVVAAIRRADRVHTVWYEPVVTANLGPNYHTPHPPDSNVGFNFHDYCPAGTADPPCGALEQAVVDNAAQRAAANGDPALLSEFGATDDLPTIGRMVDRSDRAMISWMWWHYCGCADPTTSGPGDTQALVHDPKRPPRGSNVFHAKLAALDRPYPQAVAGTPRSFFYDAATNRFTLRYSTRAPGGRLDRGAETVVYVPRVHYPHGYRAIVDGASVKRTSRRSRYLRLRNRPGARTVSLEISPPAGARQ